MADYDEFRVAVGWKLGRSFQIAYGNEDVFG